MPGRHATTATATLAHKFKPRRPPPAAANDLVLTRYQRIMAQVPAPKRPVKVLMLHGFTQSGPSFHAKTRALEKNLIKAFPAGISLTYLTGPHRLARADIPFPLPSDKDAGADGQQQEEGEIDAWSWWRAKKVADGEGAETLVYEGLEEGLASVAAALREKGPFDGVVGFSQGAACAAMVTSLLEPNRKAAFTQQTANSTTQFSFPSSFDPAALQNHPPFAFAALYSGFLPAPQGSPAYAPLYDPKIATPTLHFIGTLDAVVDEARSLALAGRCEGTGEGSGKIVYHPGGHFLPASQKAYVSALIGFMKETLAKAENGAGGDGSRKEEESVEDMDMPF